MKKELEAFKYDSEIVKQIVIEKPYKWEFLLSLELLKVGLDQYKTENDQILANHKTVSVSALSDPQAIRFFKIQMEKLTNTVNKLSSIVKNELATSWLKSENPNKAIKIKTAVNNINQEMRQLIKWEKEVIKTNPPEKFNKLKSLYSGVTLVFFSTIEEFINKLVVVTEQAESGGKYDVNVELDFPEGWVDKVTAEMQQIKF